MGEEAVTDAIISNVVQTHPHVLPGGLIPVTMQDALMNMAPLAERFGAAGDHPGFLDPAEPTYADVLTDAFQFSMIATSNLHWHEGVQLGVGKSYMALVDDQTGPTWDDVLEFDFMDPQSFWVSGIAEDPRVDLTLRIFEHEGWVSVGDSPFPLPRGNGEVWDLDPWLLEAVFAEGAYLQYQSHRSGCDLCDGADSGALLWEVPLLGIDEAELVVGRQGYDKHGDGEPTHFDMIDPNPAGWLRVWTLFGLGSPPEPQYVWDMMIEVAQRRLLDGGVTEGEGDVRFRVEDVPVGIGGSALVEAMRPVMQTQTSKLSDLLLGDYGAGGAPMDFFLARGVDGLLRLHFVVSSDPLPSGSATHGEPGFFADEALTQKVSSLVSVGSGDSLHEKLPVGTDEQTVYCMSTNDDVYELKVLPQGDAGVQLSVRQKLGGSP